MFTKVEPDFEVFVLLNVWVWKNFLYNVNTVSNKIWITVEKVGTFLSSLCVWHYGGCGKEWEREHDIAGRDEEAESLSSAGNSMSLWRINIIIC